MFQKILTWFFILALIFIHTADMELTQYYIGNNAYMEGFPLMRWSIGQFGIEISVWISRVIMYAYFWLALVNRENRWWFYFLLLVTVLYWVSMIPWWFQLGLVKWPFPTSLYSY